MFSPYYAAARRRRPAADPLRHCAFNVALYPARGRGRWSMTERGAGQLERGADLLRIGPSRLRRDGDVLTWSIDEWSVPWPARLRGTVRLAVRAWADMAECALDAGGRHHWRVHAAQAPVEVRFERPDWGWRGTAYLDANRGSRPLEADFRGWDWSRARLADGRTRVLYDLRPRDGADRTIALDVAPHGATAGCAPPGAAAASRTAWGLLRSVPNDPGAAPPPLRSLEDGPFYARAVAAACWQGERVDAMHEVLSLERFARRGVQAMLPFRMPRRG